MSMQQTSYPQQWYAQALLIALCRMPSSPEPEQSHLHSAIGGLIRTAKWHWQVVHLQHSCGCSYTATGLEGRLLGAVQWA